MAPPPPRSVAALLIGALLSMVISGALVIATAKAGISPGVSPLVVLIGWVVFGSMMRAKLRPFLALLQVTGSGGAAVSAGLIFTAPIIQIAADEMGRPVPSVDIVTTLLACVSGSLLGWGFVGLAAKRFLSDPRLPAPEAVACHQLIETAAQNPEERPPVSRSLIPALLGGFVIRSLVFLKWLGEEGFKATLPLPQLARENALSLPFPISPLYFGIGALLTFPTAILIFCGGVVNATARSLTAELNQHPGWDLPDETYRWVGGAAMVVAVVASLVSYAREGARQSTKTQTESSTDLLDLPARVRNMLVAAITSGALLLVVILFRTETSYLQIGVLSVVSLILISLLSGLGGLLSLQVGASASPVSGTVFMAMLVLSITGLSLSLTGFVAIETLHPVLVAACVAIAAANDSSQDYKTIQLNQYPVHSVFTGQLVGCLVGAVTVPISLWVAHDAFGLGTDELPCPQAAFFSTVLSSLFAPDKQIPWGPVGIGGLLGCIAVAIEYVGKRRGIILSSLAFAVGIYLPASMGIGILTGNLARVVGARSVSRTSHRGILSAAGLIAGDSLLSLLAGVLIVCQIDLSGLESPSELSWQTTVLGMACLLVFIAMAYANARASHDTSG